MKKIKLLIIELFFFTGIYAQVAVQQSNTPIENNSNSNTLETIAILLGSLALTGFLFYLVSLFIFKKKSLKKSH